jgi:hypothetical protein
MSTSESGTSSMPHSTMVPQPFSNLSELHQALSHEYGRFQDKPTKVGGQRIRKHLSMMQKHAKEMRNTVLNTMKAMPKNPRSNKTKVAGSNPQVQEEVLQTQINEAINDGANPRTGSGKSGTAGKPKKVRAKKQA